MVPLIPKLQGHFAEFLQHHSLKRLGILYLPTCVGLGTIYILWLFPGTISLHFQSNKKIQVTKSVTTNWLRNINLIPIHYGFRPRVRGRLTLLRLTLSRNPWTFGDRVSHSVYRYSCQHSHFRSLHRMPHGPASLKDSSDLPSLKSEAKSAESISRNAPLPHLAVSSASAHGLSPVTSSPQDNLSRPVSCYAFFK